MRYGTKIVSCLLMIGLLISAVYTDKMTGISAAGSSQTGIRLRIGNLPVSKKTISIKKGKKKKIKVIVSKKKNYKITFRSNKSSVVSVSKTGRITAKKAGAAKITVIAKSKKKKYKNWIKIKVVSSSKKSDVSLPTKTPAPSPTVTPALPSDIPTAAPSDAPTDLPTIAPTDTPTAAPTDTPTTAPTDLPTTVPSVSPTTTPTEGPTPDTGEVSDMYEITIRVNEKAFPAKLYQTETTKSIMQKLPLSITMNELNGNEKYYYFSESFPTETQKVSQIHAGDLKLYGSSCLVLFYESFSTSYSYTSLGYVENLEGLAEALGKGNVSVEIFGSE